MKLILDHTQRLNLHAIMGQQRGTVDDCRLFWRLQDRINLDDDERKAINYKIAEVNGMPQATWSLNGLGPATYDFSDDEIARLRRMFAEFQQGFAANDRLWLEPLLTQLEASSNGNAAR